MAAPTAAGPPCPIDPPVRFSHVCAFDTCAGPSTAAPPPESPQRILFWAYVVRLNWPPRAPTVSLKDWSDAWYRSWAELISHRLHHTNLLTLELHFHGHQQDGRPCSSLVQAHCPDWGTQKTTGCSAPTNTKCSTPSIALNTSSGK